MWHVHLSSRTICGRLPVNLSVEILHKISRNEHQSWYNTNRKVTNWDIKSTSKFGFWHWISTTLTSTAMLSRSFSFWISASVNETSVASCIFVKPSILKKDCNFYTVFKCVPFAFGTVTSRKMILPSGFTSLKISPSSSVVWLIDCGKITPDNTASNDEVGWDPGK
jgi:hypothetical protein